MNPFSFKSDLEAQAADEWTDFIRDNLFNRLLQEAVRSLMTCLKRLLTLRVRVTAPTKTQTAGQPQSRSRSPLPR